MIFTTNTSFYSLCLALSSTSKPMINWSKNFNKNNIMQYKNYQFYFIFSCVLIKLEEGKYGIVRSVSQIIFIIFCKSR